MTMEFIIIETNLLKYPFNLISKIIDKILCNTIKGDDKASVKSKLDAIEIDSFPSKFIISFVGLKLKYVKVKVKNKAIINVTRPPKPIKFIS